MLQCRLANSCNQLPSTREADHAVRTLSTPAPGVLQPHVRKHVLIVVSSQRSVLVPVKTVGTHEILKGISKERKEGRYKERRSKMRTEKREETRRRILKLERQQ